MRRNYERKLWGEIITGNLRRNYHRKLSASIYHHAKNVGIIGILAYPKIKSKRKRRNRRIPLPFRGKRAENCLHNVGNSLGEGLAEAKIPYFGSFRVFLWVVEEITFLIKNTHGRKKKGRKVYGLIKGCNIRAIKSTTIDLSQTSKQARIFNRVDT